MSQPTTPFWKQFIPLFAAGAIGLAAIVPALAPAIARRLAEQPDAPEISAPALAALMLIQPSILLGVAVAAGIVAAPRLGFTSHIREAALGRRRVLPALKQEAPLAVAAGATAALALLALDYGLRDFWGREAIQALEMALPRNLQVTLAGVLYGGITEELLMRWGLMSLLVLAGRRLLQRGGGAPQPAIAWTGIAAAALLFGAGHLPATAAIVSLTPALVIRALLLNALPGLLFGWLYWRRSLESAMMAHASLHIAVSLVSLLALR